jgi:glycosyltransferase involved in cell wall biosynthesis
VRSANSVIYDPRVWKIVKSLSKRYRVTALGWDREGVPKKKLDNYIVQVKLFRLKTSFWKPSLARLITRLVIFFPLFWVWVFVNLVINRPGVVHACDLDTVLPCYAYKKIFRKRLIFDVFDRYAMVFVPAKFKRFFAAVNWLEELLGYKADGLIIAGGQKVLETFTKRPAICDVIMNCPEDYVHMPDKKERFISNSRNNGGSNSNSEKALTVVYTGGIRRGRALENLVSIINGIKDVNLVIAGPIMDKELFVQINQSPRISYEGVFEPSDALALEKSSDVMIALYDTTIAWNRITLPNKLFEAMMCGIPVITNIASEMVNDTKCGILVKNYYDVKEITDAIITLRDDNKLRKTLGENGRKAFLQRFNWHIMECRLYNLYENITTK